MNCPRSLFPMPCLSSLPFLLSLFLSSTHSLPLPQSWDVVQGVKLPLLKISEGCYCSPEIKPVCGASSMIVYTYMNECVLNCTKDVQLLYEGPCCSTGHCSPYSSPVCDSLNNIYRNPCTFEEAQCLSHRILKVHLSMDSSVDACSCVRTCPEEYSPVCDTAGHSHPSPCAFHNAQCFLRQQGQHVDVLHEGVCCQDLCTSPSSDPVYSVCDSEGVSHSDLCSFYKARCELSFTPSPLLIRHFGPCSSALSLLTMQ